MQRLTKATKAMREMITDHKKFAAPSICCLLLFRVMFLTDLLCSVCCLCVVVYSVDLALFQYLNDKVVAFHLSWELYVNIY